MELQQLSPVTMCMVKAALAAGTTTTISNTGAVVYAINGKAYSVAAMTNAATPTTDGNTGVAFVGVPANYGSIFVHGYNAAGTLMVLQGSVEPLDAGGNFINAPKMPPIPADFCPFAYLVIKAGSTASTWTYGTSNQSGATGVTYTRQDVCTLPSRLQIS